MPPLTLQRNIEKVKGSIGKITIIIIIIIIIIILIFILTFVFHVCVGWPFSYEDFK